MFFVKIQFLLLVFSLFVSVVFAQNPSQKQNILLQKELNKQQTINKNIEEEISRQKAILKENNSPLHQKIQKELEVLVKQDDLKKTYLKQQIVYEKRKKKHQLQKEKEEKQQNDKIREKFLKYINDLNQNFPQQGIHQNYEKYNKQFRGNFKKDESSYTRYNSKFKKIRKK